MFRTDVDADKATNIGIKYIKLSASIEPIDSESVSGDKVAAGVSGKNAVQGDINNIDINKTLAEKYYAAAFIEVGGKTYWSAPISCTLDKERTLTGYTPTKGGNE